jgi:flagellar biosynthesis component FlhA
LIHIPCAQRSLIDLLLHPLLPTFLYVCLSVYLSIYYQGKRKWKEAKELTKNEKKRKNKKQEEEVEKSDRNAKGERCVIAVVVVVPSFLPSREPMQ